MPLKLLLDENLRHESIRLAIAAQQAGGMRPLDVLRVGDLHGPELSATDAILIAWAAANDRIIVSLDAKTLGSHLNAFIRSGHHSPGIIVLKRRLSATEIVILLELVCFDTQSSDWSNAVRWLP